MTYPIRSVPDGDTAWGGDLRAVIAGVNDHQTRVSALESASSAIIANTQTASYTLVLSDAGKVIEMNSASATNVTIPPNSSVAFPTGTLIEVFRYGAGAVTIVAGAGVTTPHPAGAPLTLRVSGSAATLRKRATDEWVIGGDLG